MDLSLKVAIFYVIAFYLAYIAAFVLYRTWFPSLRNIPGPKPPSWLYGNIPQLVFTERYGDHEFQWQRVFGKTYRLRGCLGEDKLFTSDPVALKHVFKNNHIFTKGYYHRQLVWMLMGEWSIFRIFHDVHARIRPVLNTAFSQARIQHAFPTLRGVSMRVADKLEEIIGLNTSDGQVVNIYHLLQHATADVVAEVIMGYHFHAVKEDGGVEVARAHQSIVFASSTKTKSGLLADSLIPFFPGVLLRASLNLPTDTFKLLKSYRRIMSEWSDTLYVQKLENLCLWPDPEMDLLGVAVKESEKRDHPTKLSADELKDQIPTMLIAGQDTTGNSLAFAILELARHPEWQGKIRKEIMQLQGDLNCSSLDKLVYLNAHIKENLRYHPVLPNTERLATEDTLLPLSKPIKTNSGHILTELHIKQGQLVTIGLASYNRDPDIWGDDAHCFDPYRWIDERSTKLPGGTSFGPYANIASFIGGPHTCLGWRLALLEMQVILADLVSKFSFEEVEDVVIRPRVAVIMQPVSEKGLPHLPLRVKRLDP